MHLATDYRVRALAILELAKNDPQHQDRWLALAHSLLSMAVVEDVNRGTLPTTMLTEVQGIHED
jgi:hypothetical protein